MSSETMIVMLGLLAGVGVTSVLVASAYEDFAQTKAKRNCLSDVVAALANSDLSIEDISHIATQHSLKRSDVAWTLRELHRKALTGDEVIGTHIDRVRQFLQQHFDYEPFADLPENISIQLRGLSASDGANVPLVRQLATSLTTLYTHNQQQLRKQVKISIWSFAIGIVGIILAIGGLYAAFAEPLAQSSPSTPPASIRSTASSPAPSKSPP